MGKVYLADNILSGHHKVYLDTLLQIDNTVDISEETSFTMNKKNLKYIIDRSKFINKMLRRIELDDFNGEKILHLLYLDNLYTIPFWGKLYDKNLKVIATLHHLPQTPFKMMMLKNFSKKIDVIIVHSEYSKLQLIENGICNVEVVDYPSFYDYSKFSSKNEIREQLAMPHDRIVLSVLGGTRYDKGLDILLESFKYVNENVKNKVLLNIVGKEETYTKEFINNKIKEYNINTRIELGFVEDDDFCKNVLISDFVVLPYREIFTGNSGPMTEAIVNNIPVIGPDYGNLGYLIKKNNLGFVFEVEQPDALAAVINEIPYIGRCSINADYIKKLTKEEFLTLYAYLYENIK